MVYGSNLAYHVLHLRLVLQTLKDNQFLVNRSKCAFGQESMEYLGHVVSAKGVHMDQHKVQAMLDWPQQKNLKELREFLGLTRYYRRFVHSYAIVATPLTELLKKNAFQWTASAQEAFDKLKLAMSTTPVLVLPNFEEEFVLEMDASNYGI